MYVLAHIPNPPLIFKIGQNLGLGIENRIGNDAGGGRAVPKLDGTQVDGACIGGPPHPISVSNRFKSRNFNISLGI